jgi:hypothetical protein
MAEPMASVKIRASLLKPAKMAALEADVSLTDWLSELVERELAASKK